MKYMGSKNRIAKDILPLMLKDRKKGQYWVEPFVGGANMIDKVTGKRLGSDVNKYLIACLESIASGWIPDDKWSESLYNDIKNNKDEYIASMTGYAGFALSYGGKWFGGWCRDSAGKRNYVLEAHKNAVKQQPKLKGIEFASCSYDELDIPSNSIIYCDPPYQATTKYKDDFDHDKFWAWCEQKVKDGHTVFVSEYNAPGNWKCIWEKEIVSSLTQDTGSKKAVERLFTLENTNGMV
jgi:DNA adenine methylase